MHALHIIRDDAQRNLGGDTIQLLKTKAALEALGVTVTVRSTGELDDLPACDIAHIFNIQTAEASAAAFTALKRKGIPTVLSSIYWDMLDHWFEFAVNSRPYWRALAQTVGKPRARAVYTAWQRQKDVINPQWRTQRHLLDGALRVLPNSQSEADLLRKVFHLNGAFQAKVDVVPNGIDPDLFGPQPEPSRAFLETYNVRNFVLEVGAISPVKNQLGVIEALFDVDVPLVFIGQPAAAMPEYAERCKARGAQRGNVYFIDRMPHEDLPGVFALAAVHVLPSWRETPGLASLEAAASGCRIVTTSIGSTHDYFGNMAWYVYPDDLKSIRAAVESALQAPPSDTLRKHILAHYTWQRAGQATMSSYEKALALHH